MLCTQRVLVGVVVTLLLTPSSCGSTIGTITETPEHPIHSAPAVVLPAPSAEEQGVSSPGVNHDTNGPFCSLITLETDKVEERLGKPSRVTDLKGEYEWVYEDLGLTLYITTSGPLRKWVVSTLYQKKGWVMDSLQIGDSEEQVVAVMGKVIAAPNGERFAQATADGCVFTVTVKEGRAVKSQLIPVGRDD